MAKIVTAGEAADLIADEACVYIGGSGGGHAVPETMLAAIADAFERQEHPRQLTICSSVAIGDSATQGFNRLSAKGLLKRVISGGLNVCPKLVARVLDGSIEAYTLPQGTLSQLCRDRAAGRPGLVTRTGIGTFVDPRLGGGRQLAQEDGKQHSSDIVSVVTIENEEYLFFRAFPINVAIIRGSIADEKGNISMEREAFRGENFSIAMAAKRNGGIVIAQVASIAAAGSLQSRRVETPGCLIDYIVVDPDQRQTYLQQHSAAYDGSLRVPDNLIASIPFDIRKSIARRGAMELFAGAIVNLGYGVSNGISAIAAEEGFYKDITLTVEQGIIGGVPAGGMDAGAGVNFDMMSAQPDQFDFYDGGGLDIAFLSFAEVDSHGNVNVSRYEGSINGPGGFINISQGAKRVIFSGTLTAKGLKVSPDGNSGVRIEREGSQKKWLKDVRQITFSGRHAIEKGQEVLFLTDRAVFRLTPQGMMITEIAEGAGLERDVLQQIQFPVLVSATLKKMDSQLFVDRRMGLKLKPRPSSPTPKR